MNQVRLHICVLFGLLLVGVPLTGCSEGGPDNFFSGLGGAAGLSLLEAPSSPISADESSTAENSGGSTDSEQWWPLSEQGVASAQYSLGKMFSAGEGVSQDYKEAARWYRLAAEQEHVLAQTELGRLYSTGHGVPQDNVQAHMWLTLAVMQGNEDAMQYRDSLVNKMTALQVAKAQNLARERKSQQ